MTPPSPRLRASGASDPGCVRSDNEDRVFADAAHGLFLVIDGVGGHAAGDLAADLTLAVLRDRLASAEGPAEARLRAAIAAANNAVFKRSQAAPSLAGMGCVLTIALVGERSVTVGHVGDTRLYEISADGLRKVTRDHSVVGRLEDDGLLDETAAMAHPRRHEILRDLGSAWRHGDDADFIDVYHLPFAEERALLLCSDGLTDLVPGAVLHATVLAHAGRPEAAVRALIAQARAAGGYDNITALVVEGPRFAEAVARASSTNRPGAMPHSFRHDPDAWEGLQRRMQERRWLLAASLILLMGLLLTYRAKTRTFDETEALLAAGDVVNLSTLTRSAPLVPVFAALYPDPRDQALAAEHTVEVLSRLRAQHRLPGWHLPNVGRLNTAAFAVPVEQAARGGHVFRSRLADAGSATTVPLLGSMTAFQRLKPRLVVRSPGRYRWTFWILAGLFFLGFYAVHADGFARRFRGDPFLLPLLHLLTGLGLLLMFSLPDPLRDLMRAQGFVGGVLAGCLLLALVSRVDFQQAFWRRRAGWWLGLGLGLAALLFVFGRGPTGSTARVNLTLPGIGTLQPVEFVKLCLLLFLAGYFARHWLCLRELQQRDGLPRWLQRLHLPRYDYLVPVAGGVLVALGGFYLLRDMGPALVMGCTFLGLYGIARRRWLAVGAGVLLLAAAFALAYTTQTVPVVAGRVEMMLSPWENFVEGGEHLAHAHWAMAAGGATGQGLGRGHPHYIPAAHTDLVLPALGEELGLLGLLAVLGLYALLLHRSLHIALHAGGVFSLFLGLGIALVLLFQIVLIVGGGLGLVPLSGVVTPFLSYGKSAMMAHCAMMGALLSLSARPGADVQAEAQRRHFRGPVRVLMGSGLLLLGVLAAKSAYVQVVAADAWTIRPALVLRSDGARSFTYNPRLLDARRHLVRGTITDRHGLPLASSRWDELERFRDAYAALGVSLDSLDRAAERYYPFEALTFYLLGDVRSRVKWGADNSLYAEHRFLSHLRGYDNTPRPVRKQRTATAAPEPIVRYDYAELVPLVRHGPDHPAARRLIARDRTLRLTVDMRLQARVAALLEERVPDSLTASALVLDAATGAVLASVTTPLPRTAFTAPSAAHRDPQVFDRGFGGGAKPPGSTFKLVTAMAALRQDPAVPEWTVRVHAGDRYARRGEPTGEVDLERAITGSSNVYFAALAREVVGAEALWQMLNAFGFGLGPPGLTPRQQRALLLEPDNLRQAGFGQGPVTASPLPVALVAATIAGDGRRPPVHWVEADTAGAPVRLLTPGQARLLARAMRRVVTDPQGTAYRLHDAAVPIAGKTGTAEERKGVVREGRRTLVTVNHAWFTGFAPYGPVPDGTRRVAVAVLVEEGGTGSRVAAPLAGAIFEAAAELGLIGWEP